MKRKVRRIDFEYSAMTKTLQKLKSGIEAGLFTYSEVIVMLGESWTGKMTFIRMLSGLMNPDDPSVGISQSDVSCKPQMISLSFDGSVKILLLTKILSAWTASAVCDKCDEGNDD